MSRSPRSQPIIVLSRTWLSIATGVLLTSAGCQSLGPGMATGLFPSRNEKAIEKLAARDPFPSPADVGLTQATPTP